MSKRIQKQELQSKDHILFLIVIEEWASQALCFSCTAISDLERRFISACCMWVYSVPVCYAESSHATSWRTGSLDWLWLRSFWKEWRHQRRTVICWH